MKAEHHHAFYMGLMAGAFNHPRMGCDLWARKRRSWGGLEHLRHNMPPDQHATID